MTRYASISEQRLQGIQQREYQLNRTIEQTEDRLAVYRHERLQNAPTPELPAPYSYPYPANPLPSFSEAHPELHQAYEYAVYRWAPKGWHPKLLKNTVLVIDNGGLGKTIEQLSEIYHVVVWRLEDSGFPFPEQVEEVYLPLAEFNYEVCMAGYKALKERVSPLAAVLIDGLTWQTPLFSAADAQVPVILAFERSTTAEAPPPTWLYSQWRIKQSFFWSFEVLCVDTDTVAYFQEQDWLSTTDYITVAPLAQRDRAWWQQQVSGWQRRYGAMLEQGQYLLQAGLDSEYYLGSEQWRRDSTPEQQMLHFLLSWRRQMYLRQLLPGFDMIVYAEHHPQLRQQELHPTVDYLQKGRPDGPWVRQMISPNAAEQPEAASVALHIHAYYIDRLPDLLHCLSFNQIKPDLFISVRSQGEREMAAEYLENYEGVVKALRIVPNKGRDIGPFLTEFGQEMMDNYDFIGHVHTKESRFHSGRNFITAWQHFLQANVLGSPDQPMLDSIIAAMQQDSSLALVYPDDPNLLSWDWNVAYAEQLIKEMGIEQPLPSGYFTFPVGTMFWLRAEVLKPLLDLQLQWEDYPDEPLAQDGSMLHAIERIFGLLPGFMGLRSATTYTPGVSR